MYKCNTTLRKLFILWCLITCLCKKGEGKGSGAYLKGSAYFKSCPTWGKHIRRGRLFEDLRYNIIVRINFIFLGKDDSNETDICTTPPRSPHHANYFECKKPILGSFLQIRSAYGPQRELSLCEVEVFQSKIGEYVLPSWFPDQLTAVEGREFQPDPLDFNR